MDISPNVDRLPYTPEVSGSQTIIIGGGSHASRLAAAVGSIYPEVVDLTIGGWKLSEKSAEDLAYDIENVMDDADPATTTIILHIFDNSVFMGEEEGGMLAPEKIAGRFHIRGRLATVNAKGVKELFETAMPIMRAARGAELLIIGPLPRYLVAKCFNDPGHITNFDETGFGAKLCAGVKEVGIHLRSLLHTRRIKAAKILNPWVLMGLTGSDSGNPLDTLRLWGSDPVHPLDTAYSKMAISIMEEINVTSVVHTRRSASPSAARGTPRQSNRESWTEETPTVAQRTGKWSHGGSRGSGGGGHGRYITRGPHSGKRGGRDGRGGRRHWRSGGHRRPY